MSTTTLTRQSVALDSDRELLKCLGLCTNLVEEAKWFLGYHAGAFEYTKLIRETQSRISLKQAMQDLFIDPFSSTSVFAYQRRMVNLNTPVSSHLMPLCWFLLQLTIILGILGGCIVTAAAVVSGICHFCGSIVGSHAFMTWAQTGYGLITLLVSIICVCHLPESINITVAEWRSFSISEYAGAIPEFVLQTAVELKRKCPEVEFFVEELCFKTVMLDPFLVVKDASGTKYYLEVWNEPGFLQKRAI